jgi:hypothetical protein
MQPTPVVMGHPFAKDPAEMSLVERDQPVQALPTHCAAQSLTKGVRLPRPHVCLEHSRPIDAIARSKSAA